jgi:LmbE family N-acetylglucosaminyl deacetylase
VSAERSILFSFAHPDDESFLVAGISCKYSEQGVRLALATATLGEAGKVGDPPVCKPEDLPKVREAELSMAARLVGIQDVHLLGHRDQQLASASPEKIRRQLVQIIRQHCPQIIVTFDPNGANLHPDHIAISRFTSDAVGAAGDSRWFPEEGTAHQVSRVLWPTPVVFWEVLRAGKFDEQSGVDFAVDIRSWSQRKAEALRAHRSQHLSVNRVFFTSQDSDLLLTTEVFRQAWGPPLSRRPAEDLFAGI